MVVAKKNVIFSPFNFCEVCTNISADKPFLKNSMSHLQKSIILLGIVYLLFANTGAASASADDSTPTDNNTIQSALSAIKVTGGISAGYFYASNPGEDSSDNEFLLSNFLLEISSKDETLPVGFVAAFGETSTPSLLDEPEKNKNFDIEHASLTLKPVTGISLEMGLLKPNSGFENTYTFNNKNVILGIIASQQPYNAYGARIAYDINGLSLWGGYYKGMLDEEEYNSPEYTWEAGLSGSIAGNDFNIYNYHIDGQRNLIGVVIQRSIYDVDLGFNIDYWTWDNRVKKLYGSKSSLGGAVYICPSFGNLSIPVRVEFINQDKSQIYIENPNTKHMYAATVSPTYHFNEKTYIRAESAYIKADGAFTDKDGRSKNNRINLAFELGFLF
jgi:hypothetical protein